MTGPLGAQAKSFQVFAMVGVHHGPGYRIYFVHTVASAEWVATLAPSALERWAQQPPIEEGAAVVVLLCGSDKGSQQRDIRRAKRLVEDWR